MQRPEYRAGRHERAVKVYTVCDESRYLIVRNVPALGCVDELIRLCGLFGDIEEYRLLDEEDCEPFTDVYWVKYAKYSNSRFAKRKLDKYKFLGNLLEVSYAPEYENLLDTKHKLEERRRTVLNRIEVNKGGGVRTSQTQHSARQLRDPLLEYASGAQQYPPFPLELLPRTSLDTSTGCSGTSQHKKYATEDIAGKDLTRQQRFDSPSVDATVRLVREKLDKVSKINVLPLTNLDEGMKPKTLEIGGDGTGAKRPTLDSSVPSSQKRQDTRRRI